MDRLRYKKEKKTKRKAMMEFNLRNPLDIHKKKFLTNIIPNYQNDQHILLKTNIVN